jgi:AraC-like DNA-binding protein
MIGGRRGDAQASRWSARLLGGAEKCVNTHVETGDLEVAYDMLSHAYGARRFSVTGDGPHRLRLSRDDCGAAWLNRATFSMTLRAEVPRSGTWMVGRVLRGTLGLRSARRDEGYAAGDPYVAAQPGDAYLAAVGAADVDFASLPPALLLTVAEPRSGRPAPIRFTGYRTGSEADVRLWNDTYAHVRGIVRDWPAAGHPLMIGSAARLLAASALSVFPNDALREPAAGDRRDAHPVSLRRAVSFIDDNAHRDISPAQIAGAARVTIRTVQLAFRRHLGTSPMAYVRRVRLDKARVELRTADPATTTVGAVAARWGFGNHSRFTARYQATYGTTPSRTLRGG